MNLKMETPVGIFGKGLTGLATLRLLRQSTLPKNQIFLFDEKSLPEDMSLGDFLKESNFKTLVVSPGVPLAKPEIQKFIQQGGKVTSELEIAWTFLTQEQVLCVTGSVGKSTVAALLHTALKTEDPNTFIGGNFGFPLADYVADILEGKRPRAKYVVLELSSYQLENFPSLVAHGTILTSLLSNHLERYPTKQDYFLAKWSLLQKSKGPIVLNKTSGDLESFFEDRLKNQNSSQPDIPWEKCYWTDHRDLTVPQDLYKKSPLLGAHNRDNIAMAYQLLKCLGLQHLGPSLALFQGLAHRVENCGVINGVQYINDSKATTMESVIQAVATVTERLTEGHKIVLLLGGRDKNLPWQNLSQLKGSSGGASPKIQFLFFGEFALKAKALSGLDGPVFDRLAPALEEARKHAQPGDIVLLSPGGSSLDEFGSFEKRGDYFKNLVSQLTPSPT